jgi:SAM-dependent methyltransferase
LKIGNWKDRTKIINILDNIFAETNGYKISSLYRDKMKITDKSMVYGEATFSDFAKILDKCGSTKNKIFYDLGCGTGKTCFVASFLFDFEKVIGIELITDLYLTAQKLKENIPEEYKEYADKIHFTSGDITKENFLDGDIIFINATCFEDNLFENIISKLHKLKNGSYLIMTTKIIESGNFEMILESTEIEYSWGYPTTRIYQKIK